MHTALGWLLLNILSIMILSFYSMLEMACVSFNKVRLQYYVSTKMKRAEWLNWLLHNPTRLFSTTLIGVNIATFVGSEFAREFHSALGIDPDWSIISQVLLVVIFGELAPMFAARRYAEHVAMLGVPLVYASAKLLTPVVWLLSIITKLCSKIIGGKQSDSNIFLTREELQKILEEHDEERPPTTESEEFNAVTANIFKLSMKDVRQVMEPIAALPKMPSNATIAQVGNVLARSDTDYVAVYHREVTNIVGIVHAKDLLRLSENRRVRDFARPPWFVTQNTNLLQILNQFSRNNESMGIILNQQGQAEGFLRLSDLIDELFGTGPLAGLGEGATAEPVTRYIECTVSGLMKIGDFNSRFNVVLDPREELTLSELLEEELGHHPEVGDSIYLEPFELKVEATTLTGVKSVQVTTHMS